MRCRTGRILHSSCKFSALSQDTNTSKLIIIFDAASSSARTRVARWVCLHLVRVGRWGTAGLGVRQRVSTAGRGMPKLVFLTRMVQDSTRTCGIQQSAVLSIQVQFGLTGFDHRATSSRRLFGGGFCDAWRETRANRPPNIPHQAAP